MKTYEHKVTGGGCLNNQKELAIMEDEGWHVCGIGFSNVYWKRERVIKHKAPLLDTEIENLANKFSAAMIPKWTSGFVTGFKECYAMFFKEKPTNETPHNEGIFVDDKYYSKTDIKALQLISEAFHVIKETIELDKLNTFFKYYQMWQGHPSVGTNVAKAFNNWLKQPENHSKPSWITLNDTDIVAAWWNILADEDKERIAFKWFDRTKVFPDGIKRYQIDYLFTMETKNND